MGQRGSVGDAEKWKSGIDRREANNFSHVQISYGHVAHTRATISSGKSVFMKARILVGEKLFRCPRVHMWDP